MSEEKAAAQLASAEEKHGMNHPQLLEPLNSVFEIHLKAGNNARCEELLRRSLEICQQMQPPDPHGVKLAKQKLAWLKFSNQDFEGAESLFVEAIDAVTESPEQVEESVAQAIRCLVYFYLHVGKLKESEDLLHNLLNLYQNQNQDPGYKSAFVFMAIAVVAEANQESDKSKLYLEKAAGIIKDKCAIGYTVDFLSLSEIISLYFNQERKQEALELAALTMLESEDSSWPHNPQAALALAKLAEYMRGQRKFKQAEALYKRALAIKEFLCGKDDPDYAGLCLNLGNMYLGLRKYADAEPLVKDAMKARVKNFGSEHPAVAACVETYATILRKTKRVALANKLDHRAREIRSGFVLRRGGAR